jgi:hypothetical protein
VFQKTRQKLIRHKVIPDEEAEDMSNLKVGKSQETLGIAETSQRQETLYQMLSAGHWRLHKW